MDAFESLQKANEIVRNKRKSEKSEMTKAEKRRERYWRNVEKYRALSRKYYAEHREEIKARYKNDDKRKEYLRNYSRERNALLMAAGQPTMSEENKVNWNLRRKERYANDPEYRKRVLEANRKSKLKKLLGIVTN